MKRIMLLLAVMFAAIPLFAKPTISNVSARQRHPWNGLVDIKFTVRGNDEGYAYDFSVVATNLDKMAVLPVKQLSLWRGDICISDALITSNGTYRAIWNVADDVGDEVINNLWLCIHLRDPFAEHSAVQLWENGPYWAECNIGAEAAWDSGYYFWWGDTIGYKHENNQWVASDRSVTGFSFSDNNTPNCGNNITSPQCKRWITSDGVLAAEYDAAKVHWGGGWQMPTVMDVDSLIRNTTTEWITTNGVSGRLVRGKGAFATNGIFLPAAGYGSGTSLRYLGSYGYYWSSMPNSDVSSNVWGLYFGSGRFIRNNSSRYCGKLVRPLREFADNVRIVRAPHCSIMQSIYSKGVKLSLGTR